MLDNVEEYEAQIKEINVRAYDASVAEMLQKVKRFLVQ